MSTTAKSLLCLCALSLAGCAGVWQTTKLLLAGDSIELREDDAHNPRQAHRPSLLVLALDGVDRQLLYPMLRDGELPRMAALLGGGDNGFPHTYFGEGLLSTLPSSTAVSWASIVTGTTPAQNGVTGNEFFIRAQQRFAAPVPVTISDITPVQRIYTEGYANKLLEVPTVYQRMRQREPRVRIWVAMHQYYSGADLLLLTDRTVLVKALETSVQSHIAAALSDAQSLSVFRELDEESVENTVESLRAAKRPPDVLTVYLPGIDHYAHIAKQGPDAARREYLKKAVEPLMADLRKALAETHALADRYVVLTSDHGHTEVVHDDAHALSMTGGGEPPDVLERAGFTVRPFRLEVDPQRHFDTVLAYQGAMAYVYVADRSSCPDDDIPCDWRRPARAEDIRAVAQAFYGNNQTGELVPEMRGTLDMVLVRVRSSQDADGPVFEVYRGGGRSQPIDAYLRAHPHPAYAALPERIQQLAAGPYGDRAGDVILIAHNGDRDDPQRRYYFASLYRSWHGSPSHRDSDVPLIVAHPGRTTADLGASVRETFAGRAGQRHFADLLLRLRYPEQPQ